MSGRLPLKLIFKIRKQREAPKLSFDNFQIKLAPFGLNVFIKCLRPLGLIIIQYASRPRFGTIGHLLDLLFGKANHDDQNGTLSSQSGDETFEDFDGVTGLISTASCIWP